MPSLYEINAQIEQIYETAVDMETGEIDPEAIEALEALQMERDAKIENVALWHKNVLAESKAIADEIKALQDRKKRLESKINWMDNYLEYALQGQKFETAKVQISYRKSQAVEIADIARFIEGYKDNPALVTEKIDYAPNKTEIKKMLKDGQKIEGAVLVERQNMQIK